MKDFNYFNDLGLPGELNYDLNQMGFKQPTPIQKAAIPLALQGKDILGTAQTGTGKTGAFGIPMLSSVYQTPGKQGLILAPTRELAAQIFKVMSQMAKRSGILGVLVVGGESFPRQQRELTRDWDFIVATPGRLNDHLDSQSVDLSGISLVVLDEADRMLDMGFLPQIESVLKTAPKQRQTMLFSATLPNSVLKLASRFLKNPARVEIAHSEQSKPKIKEEIVRTSSANKNQALVKELEKRKGKVLVFVKTQDRTHRVARLLELKGHRVSILHGGRNQGQRKKALSQFRMGSHPILVATDIAGRGIDISDIGHVINFDLPANREDYIHRIGRTGRFGAEGIALTFLTERDRRDERIVLGR